MFELIFGMKFKQYVEINTKSIIDCRDSVIAKNSVFSYKKKKKKEFELFCQLFFWKCYLKGNNTAPKYKIFTQNEC